MSKSGAVRMVKRLGSRPFFTWLQVSGMDTGAPVSMPLTWSQVKKGLDPKRFTIRTAPDLLKGNHAWEDYFEAEKPLGPAIKRLKGK